MDLSTPPEEGYPCSIPVSLKEKGKTYQIQNTQIPGAFLVSASKR